MRRDGGGSLREELPLGEMIEEGVSWGDVVVRAKQCTGEGSNDLAAKTGQK